MDNNNQFSDVDKLAFLREYLEWPAKFAIPGFSINGVN